MADEKTVSYPTYTVPDHILNRFPVAPRSIWSGAAEKDWNNWIWQQQQRVKNLEGLEK